MRERRTQLVWQETTRRAERRTCSFAHRKPFPKQRRGLVAVTLVCAAGLFVAACDSGKPSDGGRAGGEAGATAATASNASQPGGSASSGAGVPSGGGAVLPPGLPTGFFASKPPADAKGVVETKKSASVGDLVTVRGRIGGSPSPIVADRAMFTLADLGMKTCAEIEGDACKTPWDYCCEPATEIANRSLTVQVVGGDGKVAHLSLEGLGGLKPMAEVIVTGKVAKKRSDKLFIVDAAQVYVKRD